MLKTAWPWKKTCLLHLILRWDRRWTGTHTAHKLSVRECNYCSDEKHQVGHEFITPSNCLRTVLIFLVKRGECGLWKRMRVHRETRLKLGFQTKHTFPLPWRTSAFTFGRCDKCLQEVWGGLQKAPPREGGCEWQDRRQWQAKGSWEEKFVCSREGQLKLKERGHMKYA